MNTIKKSKLQLCYGGACLSHPHSGDRYRQILVSFEASLVYRVTSRTAKATYRSYFFLKIYLFIIHKYTVAVFRHTRRGHQISLQMVVSHHVATGI